MARAAAARPAGRRCRARRLAAHRRGGRLPADRLRERHQPHAGTRRRAPPGVRGPGRHRRGQDAARAPGARRKPAARARGGRHRAPRRVRPPRDVRGDGAAGHSGHRGCLDRPARLRRGCPARRPHRDGHRRVAGGLRLSRGGAARTAFDGHVIAGRAAARPICAGHHADRADAGAARRLRAAAAEPVERRQCAARFRRRACRHAEGGAQPGPVSDGRAGGRVLRGAARTRAGHAGCGISGAEQCAAATPVFRG